MIDVVAERSALGGLERWLHDPSVTEIMVNAGHDIWVERHGALHHVGQMRPATLLAAVEHMLAPVGILTVLTGQDVGRPSPYQLAVSGRLLVVAAVVYPDGISGAVRSAWSFLARRSTSGASSRSHQLAS